MLVFEREGKFVKANTVPKSAQEADRRCQCLENKATRSGKELGKASLLNLQVFICFRTAL